jgi:hypothetical protein
MAHVISWDSAFNSKPTSGDKVGLGYANVQETRQGIQERVEVEHEFDLSVGTDERQGLHKAGSAVAFYQSSEPTLRNGTALAATDAGLKWVNSTTFDEAVWTGTAWVSISAPVVGACYWQLPGRAAPASLYVGTTWSNISSSFAGDFFRAEGGNASAFESGEQAQSLQPHTHSVDVPISNNDTSIIGFPRAGATTSYVANLTLTSGSTGTTETRPLNRTIRIWVRTA